MPSSIHKYLSFDTDQDRRRARVALDNPLRSIEEFINRYVVTATNDSGDVTFDAAGTYTFQGAVSVSGALTVTGTTDLDGDLTLSANLTTDTGGALRTSASGQRLEISESTTSSTFVGSTLDFSGIDLYSGLTAGEHEPGLLGVAHDDTLQRSYTVFAASDVVSGGLSNRPFLYMLVDRDDTSTETRLNDPNRVYLSTGTSFYSQTATAVECGYENNNKWEINGGVFDVRLGGSDRFRVDSSGYVTASGGRFYAGIGSDDYFEIGTSLARAVIGGTERFRASAAGEIYSSRYISSGGGRYYFNNSIGSLSEASYIGHDTGGNYFRFYNAGTEFLRFAQSGTFTGFEGGSGRVWSFEAQGDGLIEWYLPTRNSASDAIMTWHTGFGSNPNLVALIRADGDLENDNGNYGTLSDERTKRNIKPLTGHRDVLIGTQPWSFTKVKKADENGELSDRKDPVDTYGYVAQRSHESIVFESGGDLLGVAENRMVPWLHAGWREHDDRLAALEAKVAALDT